MLLVALVIGFVSFAEALATLFESLQFDSVPCIFSALWHAQLREIALVHCTAQPILAFLTHMAASFQTSCVPCRRVEAICARVPCFLVWYIAVLAMLKALPVALPLTVGVVAALHLAASLANGMQNAFSIGSSQSTDGKAAQMRRMQRGLVRATRLTARQRLMLLATCAIQVLPCGQKTITCRRTPAPAAAKDRTCLVLALQAIQDNIQTAAKCAVLPPCPPLPCKGCGRFTVSILVVACALACALEDAAQHPLAHSCSNTRCRACNVAYRAVSLRIAVASYHLPFVW